MLQKAVRRGWVSVAEAAAAYLLDRGDRAWLRGRLGVLLFEEAWSVAHLVAFPERGEDLLPFVRLLASAPKSKDAAGLGALAYLVSERKMAFRFLTEVRKPPAPVVEGVRRPADFFEWAEKSAETAEVLRAVKNAEASHRRAGWPWDKAFAIAGAFLAVRQPGWLVQSLASAAPTAVQQVDLRVAIDRHTKVGKGTLKAQAVALGLNAQALSWSSFFFWSGEVTGGKPSEWWESEMRLRLEAAGAPVERAREEWDSAKPAFLDALRGHAEDLGVRVGVQTDGHANRPAKQLGLFG